MKKSIALLGLFLLSTTVIADQQQIPFSNQPEIAIENEVYELADDLMQVDSVATSCSSCISLLHIIKKMSYMSEGFLIRTLTNVCKRSKKVDDEVVS